MQCFRPYFCCKPVWKFSVIFSHETKNTACSHKEPCYTVKKPTVTRQCLVSYDDGGGRGTISPQLDIKAQRQTVLVHCDKTTIYQAQDRVVSHG